MRELVRQFLTDRIEKNRYTPDTVKLYRFYLKAFGLHRHPTEITIEQIDEFTRTLGPSHSTKNNFRKAIKAFLKWCHMRYGMDTCWERIELHVVDDRIMRVPAEDAVDEILFHLRIDNQLDRRDRAAILFLQDTACRRIELVRLQEENVDFRQRRAIVQGKGKKERFVFFSRRTRDAILDYLHKRSDNDPHVFVNQYCTQWSAEYVTRMLNKRSKNAGLKVTPHRIRQRTITNHLQAGVRHQDAAKLAGHSSQTQQRYYDASPDHLREAIEDLFEE